MKVINELAENFRKDYNLNGTVTFHDLNRIARKNDWLLHSYSKASDLLLKHNLYRYASIYVAFTYECQGMKVILYKDDLSYDKKIKAIIHEFAHILLEHTACDEILGKSTINRQGKIFEKEAKAFTKAVSTSRKQKLIKRIIPVSVIIIFVIAGFICLNIFSKLPDSGNEILPVNKNVTSIVDIEPIYEENTVLNEELQPAYITHSGSRYHLENCSSIRNSDKIPILKEEAVLGGYEACRLCLPDNIRTD